MKTNNNIRGSICFFDNTICKYLQFIKAPNNQDFINECCQFCRVYKFSTLWIAFKINVLILQTLAKNLPLGIQTFDGHSETKLYLQPMSMTWKEQYTKSIYQLYLFPTRVGQKLLNFISKIAINWTPVKVSNWFFFSPYVWAKLVKRF